MERNPSRDPQRDRQLERLAGQMRDTGVAPDRDLWPDIQAAIEREEGAPQRRTPRPRSGSWVRLTATAAALTLMLAAGWIGVSSITSEAKRSPGTAADPAAPPSSLAVIDRALDELVVALADDPENRNLSQLVLMVHKTRGNLLRRNSENLVRE